jgi:tRNA (adenine22-N1)-methyltransferase
MALSFRLQTLLDRCESGIPLWDLCCDHGLLGLEALAGGRFSEVIFNDAVAHVLVDLKARLTGLSDARIVHSLAEDIQEPLTGNLVLAGIGGEKIFKILTAHLQNGRLHARHILACPEKHGEWLSTQSLEGFALQEHLTIPHNQVTRQVLHFTART